jgi:hypothetical protein
LLSDAIAIRSHATDSPNATAVQRRAAVAGENAWWLHTASLMKAIGMMQYLDGTAFFDFSVSPDNDDPTV